MVDHLVQPACCRFSCSKKAYLNLASVWDMARRLRLSCSLSCWALSRTSSIKCGAMKRRAGNVSNPYPTTLTCKPVQLSGVFTHCAYYVAAAIDRGDDLFHQTRWRFCKGQLLGTALFL